jgi:hypothetical protein
LRDPEARYAWGIELKHVLAGGGIFGLVFYLWFVEWQWPTCYGRDVQDLRQGKQPFHCDTMLGTGVDLSDKADIEWVKVVTFAASVPIALLVAAVVAAVLTPFLSEEAKRQLFGEAGES